MSPITRIIRELSADQPIERAATLEDVRAEVLAPDRLNALVFGVFAGVALTIADRRRRRGAGVLGERTHAGVRYPSGDWIRATPSADARARRRHRHRGAGIVAGVAGGLLLTRVAGGFLQNVRLPGALTVAGAALVLAAAAVLASLMPAARASRVDVVKALRPDA